MFHLFPASNITDMRKAYKDAFLKKHNMKLGFMSAFVKAAAYALADQPAVNAGMYLNVTCNATSEMVSACMKLCICGVRLPSLPTTSADERFMFRCFNAKPQNHPQLIYCFWPTLT